jgi:hypothetical protein
MNLPVKAPAETIIVTFDFSNFTDTPTSPNVIINIESGQTDPNKDAMIGQAPVIQGALVLQQVTGGLSATSYNLQCTVIGSDSSVYYLTAVLPVSNEEPDVAQFRVDYPEFSDLGSFPRSQINYWMAFAYGMLNARRFGRQLNVAIQLFVAHNIALEARAQAEASFGGIPGGQVGPINSKSVDKVSMGYDTSAGIEIGAGHWNLTIYGTRLIRLIKIFGAGPVQIGIGAVPSGSGQGWPGPNTNPGFSTFG